MSNCVSGGREGVLWGGHFSGHPTISVGMSYKAGATGVAP